MTDTFLFDIGNVIITFDFGRAAARLAPHSRVDAAEALARVNEFTPALETGRLSPEQFVAAASEAIGYEGDPGEFVRAFEDIFELNQAIVEFIERLHADGFALHLLSNTNAIHVPFFEKTYPVFERFDGRIYSHEVGAMKPDAAIYDAAIRRLGIDPASTVYVDDRIDNCEAGRRAGFHAIPYAVEDHGAFLAAVENHL